MFATMEFHIEIASISVDCERNSLDKSLSTSYVYGIVNHKPNATKIIPFFVHFGICACILDSTISVPRCQFCICGSISVCFFFCSHVTVSSFINDVEIFSFVVRSWNTKRFVVKHLAFSWCISPSILIHVGLLNVPHAWLQHKSSGFLVLLWLLSLHNGQQHKSSIVIEFFFSFK